MGKLITYTRLLLGCAIFVRNLNLNFAIQKKKKKRFTYITFSRLQNGIILHNISMQHFFSFKTDKCNQTEWVTI